MTERFLPTPMTENLKPLFQLIDKTWRESYGSFWAETMPNISMGLASIPLYPKDFWDYYSSGELRQDNVKEENAVTSTLTAAAKTRRAVLGPPELPSFKRACPEQPAL